MARSERFELPTLGIEIRCSIQLSYERVAVLGYQSCCKGSTCASKAGMAPPVLADIGRRALVAVVGRGHIVIGKRSRRGPGTVIVEVADRVGQCIPVVIAVIAAVAM